MDGLGDCEKWAQEGGKAMMWGYWIAKGGCDVMGGGVPFDVVFNIVVVGCGAL